MDKKYEHQLESRLHRKIGGRVPTFEDVKQAYLDGRVGAKRGAWCVDGVPTRKKPVVGFFKSGHDYSLRMIAPDDIGNLFAGDMLAWAYLSDIVPIHSLLGDRKKAQGNSTDM